MFYTDGKVVPVPDNEQALSSSRSKSVEGVVSFDEIKAWSGLLHMKNKIHTTPLRLMQPLELDQECETQETKGVYCHSNGSELGVAVRNSKVGVHKYDRRVTTSCLSYVHCTG